MSGCIALATITCGGVAGGIERNIIYLANDLVAHGHDVALLTFDQPGAQAFYTLDPRVRWEKLGRTKPHSAIGFGERIDLLRRMRRTLAAHNVETLVCFHHGILVRYLLAGAFRGMHVICSERSSLSIYDYIRAPKWNINFLMLFLVDAITVQFPSYVALYPRLMRSKIRVVHNPVFAVAPSDPVGRCPLILSTGRFAAQKRFDVLVRAFHLVANEFPEWRLAIVGDGPLKPDILRLVGELGLVDRVELPAATSELHDYLRRATIYCQPSQWEGFPNAQAEAMAVGVIPVGFAATDGVANLIEDGVNGALAPGEPTAAALAGALRRIILAPQSWPAMSARAAMVAQTYSPDSWRTCWNRVLVPSAPARGRIEPSKRTGKKADGAKTEST